MVIHLPRYCYPRGRSLSHSSDVRTFVNFSLEPRFTYESMHSRTHAELEVRLHVRGATTTSVQIDRGEIPSEDNADSELRRGQREGGTQDRSRHVGNTDP